jgi:hypothetical protein
MDPGSGFFAGLSSFLQDRSQDIRGGSKVYLSAYFHNRTPDEAGITQHQLNEFSIRQIALFQPQSFETRASEIKHFLSRSPL